MQKAMARHPVDIDGASNLRHSVRMAPQIFVRTSGLSFDHSVLSDHAAEAALGVLTDAEHVKRNAVELACERLEALVPAAFEAGRKVGRALISIKRDLYNSRVRFFERHKDGIDWLEAVDQDLLSEAYQSITAWEHAHTKFNEVHSEEVRRTREVATHGAHDALFSSGLAVVNPSLYDALEAVRAGKRKLSEKDYNQLSASVMRYLLRVSRKTSPIATFGPVWTTSLEGKAYTGDSIDLPEEIRCTVSVRAALVQRLMRPLLANWENLAKNAPIRLNPTLSFIKGGSCEWWVRRFDEAPNSILTGTGLDRISTESKAVSAIAKLFQAYPNGTATFDELCSRMTDGKMENRSARVDRAIDSAWRAQLLLPVLYDHDDPLVWAREVAGLLNNDLATGLRLQIDAFASLGDDGSLPTRELVRAYEKQFSHLKHAAGDQNGSIHQSIITVDAHVANAARKHPSLPKSLTDTLSSLAIAMPALAADTSSAQLRNELRRFFDDRYPAESTNKERLSSFIQAYFDAGGVTQSELFERSVGLAQTEGDFEPDPAMRAGDAFLDKLATEAQSGKDITLSSIDLNQALSGGLEADVDYVSLQFHLQPVDGGRLYVLNQIFPGSCSTLTRFLPKDSGPEQREYLRHSLGKRIPIEVNASFGFNASSHPNLADISLSIPPIPDQSAIQTIDINSLWVERSARSGDLIVTDGAGQTYAPIYIAALNPMSLPKQYQALHAFCVNHWRHSGLSAPIIRRAMVGFDKFRALSRITIDDVVVLRRTWVVSANGLPKLDSTPAEFFRLFNFWAEEKSLPLHLFYQANVFLLGELQQSNADNPKTEQPRLYKPMPLDRGCALGVELFRQAAKKSSQGVLISEALPTPFDQSYLRENAPVAAELAVEITCSGPNND